MTSAIVNACAFVLLLSGVTAQLFVNEIHYDNTGNDVHEAIEVAGPAHTDLTGWSLVLYNGNDGAAYDTTALTGTLNNTVGGYGFSVITFPSNGIQNGSPDGIALVDANGAVVEFLSFEGTLTAVGGPADGMTSTDVGVSETSVTPIGMSLQLTGVLGAFTWSGPCPNTFGGPNLGQVFPSYFINEIHYDNFGADLGEAVEVAGPAGADLDGWSLVLYNGKGGTPYQTLALSGTLENPVSGYGFLVVSIPGLQNGAPDGLALVDPTGNVIEFLSYEGAITAVGGPADGMTSVSISIAESESTTVGFSLQRTGAAPFTWAEFPSTFGEINDGQSFRGGAPATPTPTPTAPPPTTPPLPTGTLAIGTVQGAGHVSPYVGATVTVRGVVTAVDTNGFFLQDSGDDDEATSDGIFVFTSTAPSVAVANDVVVVGSVAEYTPGGIATKNLATTQIISPSITVMRTSASLPDPVILGTGGRIPPRSLIDDDAFAVYEPSIDPIDFFESLEAMRVVVMAPTAISGTNAYGEIFTVVDGHSSPLSPRGALKLTETRFGSEKVQIDYDSGILPGFTVPDVTTGDRLTDITGVVSFNFGMFEVLPTEPFSIDFPAGLVPTSSISLTKSGSRALMATMNVLNLDPSDGTFRNLGDIIVNTLLTPDLIFLQEIQDSDGPADTAVTNATVTLSMLRDAILRAGGPAYVAIDNPFIGDGTNGGQPGGNIRVAFLYDPSRIEMVTGSLQTVVNPVDQKSNPSNPFYNSRLPLAAQFQFLPTGRVFDAINIHLGSKGGSAPLFGLLQPVETRQEDPNVNGGVDGRAAQAQAVVDYVQNLPGREFIVAGDCNEFEFVSPVSTILSSALDLLTLKLPEVLRYSYNFQGNAQQIDHAFVSSTLYESSDIEIAHVNSEFPDSLGRKVSDHDFVAFSISLP